MGEPLRATQVDDVVVRGQFGARCADDVMMGSAARWPLIDNEEFGTRIRGKDNLAPNPGGLVVGNATVDDRVRVGDLPNQP
jgi:hypothetical protein